MIKIIPPLHKNQETTNKKKNQKTQNTQKKREMHISKSKLAKVRLEAKIEQVLKQVDEWEEQNKCYKCHGYEQYSSKCPNREVYSFVPLNQKQTEVEPIEEIEHVLGPDDGDLLEDMGMSKGTMNEGDEFSFATSQSQLNNLSLSESQKETEPFLTTSPNVSLLLPPQNLPNLLLPSNQSKHPCSFEIPMDFEVGPKEVIKEKISESNFEGNNWRLETQKEKWRGKWREYFSSVRTLCFASSHAYKFSLSIEEFFETINDRGKFIFLVQFSAHEIFEVGCVYTNYLLWNFDDDIFSSTNLEFRIALCFPNLSKIIHTSFLFFPTINLAKIQIGNGEPDEITCGKHSENMSSNKPSNKTILCENFYEFQSAAMGFKHLQFKTLKFWPNACDERYAKLAKDVGGCVNLKRALTMLLLLFWKLSKLEDKLFKEGESVAIFATRFSSFLKSVQIQ